MGFWMATGFAYFYIWLDFETHGAPETLSPRPDTPVDNPPTG